VDAAPRGWGESELERSAQERHTMSRALSLPTACAGEPLVSGMFGMLELLGRILCSNEHTKGRQYGEMRQGTR